MSQWLTQSQSRLFPCFDGEGLATRDHAPGIRAASCVMTRRRARGYFERSAMLSSLRRLLGLQRRETVQQARLQRSATLSRDRSKYLFVAPGIVWVLAFTVFPLLYSLLLSFTNARLGSSPNFVGLQNYLRIPDDYRWWNALFITLFFVIVDVTLSVLLGLGLALLFNRTIRGLRFFRSLFTIPIFVAAIALGYLGLTIFHEELGPVNVALRALGMSNPPGWGHDVWAARFAIVIVDIWQWTPFAFLVILAGLASLPEELYEAARLDTSSGWQTFRWITLPLLAPVLITVTLLRTVETFKILDIPFSLTSGGPGAATQTYSFYVYQVGLRNFNQGYASALAYVLLLLMLIISTLFFSRLRTNFE
jgi:multiple sugar transport system permease protein